MYIHYVAFNVITTELNSAWKWRFISLSNFYKNNFTPQTSAPQSRTQRRALYEGFS